MDQIKIGKVYRHFKGNYYFVEDVAYDSETKERMVVYKPLYNKSDKDESEEEEIELPKLIDKNTENMYDEPEMPKTIEELKKEKNKNQNVDLVEEI